MVAANSRKAVKSSGVLDGLQVSASMRATRLSLPATHNRDVTLLLDLVQRPDAGSEELRSYADRMNRGAVFAVIQAVSRRLGDNWVKDKIDFADLSVSMARLHELLQFATKGMVAPGHQLSFAILLQPFDDHLMPGSLLEARLRHAGYPTEFFPSWSGGSLAGFGAVFLSVANAQRRAELARQIELIRESTDPGTPIVIGGKGASADPPIEGVDLVTSSLLEAVDYCEARARKS